jgi:signal transduction histidine kinase
VRDSLRRSSTDEASVISPAIAALSAQAQSGFMGLAAAGVLLGVALLQPRQRGFPWLAGLICAFGLWCLGQATAGLQLDWGVQLAWVAAAALGPLSLGLAARLARRMRELRPFWPLIWTGAAALALAAAMWGTSRPWIGILTQTWALAGATLAVMVLSRPRTPRGEPAEAVRLRYLAGAHAIAVASAALDALLWSVGAPRVLAQLAPLLYLYVACLHVARVRVAELRQLVGSAAALSVMASGLAGVFAALRLSVGQQLDLFVFNAFVMAFLLLLAFPRVQRAVEALIERLFLADRLELERSLQPLAERLAHMLTLDEILAELLSALENTSRLRTASVFLRDDKNLGFQQAGSIGLPPRTRVSLMRHPVWVERLENSEVLLDADLRKARAGARDEPERQELDVLLATMRDLDAQIVLPLRAAGELVGFWALRDERSDESLASPEVQLLRRVADRLARSIQDSKTFERIRARDRLVALGEMASGLAHEIRNPLAAIRGSLALLEEDAPPEDSEVFRRVLVEEIQRLDRVVESFLDYARPSTRRQRVADVGQFVKTCSAAVARGLQRPDVKLHLDAEPELPELEVDAAQLERVIANVVQNAYQALDGPGNVRIAIRSEPTADARDAWIEITISDDGRGMDEATLDRAFVPFFTTRENGTGLGLALCERVLRAQGGSIELRSRPGEGTVVQIRIPCHPPENRT